MNHHLSSFINTLPKDSFVVLHGNPEIVRSGDTHFPFRQSSDFLYLTGLSVPDLILSISGEETILWRESLTEKDILWGHSKLSDEEIFKISDIAKIREKKDFDTYGSSKNENPSKEAYTNSIHSLRIIKSPDENEKIKKALAVSKEAFEYVEQIIKPGMFEYEIEAEFARIFRRYHLTEAYPTIVASGPNACTLHYTSHNRKIEEGDLVLIDAGAEYMGYASDLTRTFFVGEVGERKKEVYDAVLRIKGIAENTLKPDISFTEYEIIVRNAMNQELQLLGLIPPNASDEEKNMLSKKYYPHRTSHFLGLDVHDVGSREAIFVSGMVLTIEPGIYIQEESIGIRIEDDYLITNSGCEKLI